jgi:hypothetical protein
MSSIFLFFLNVSAKNLASTSNYESGLKRNKRLKISCYQNQSYLIMFSPTNSARNISLHRAYPLHLFIEIFGWRVAVNCIRHMVWHWRNKSRGPCYLVCNVRRLTRSEPKQDTNKRALDNIILQLLLNHLGIKVEHMYIEHTWTTKMQQ